MAPENILGAPALGARFTALLGEPGDPGWVGVDELFGPRLPDTLATVAAARGARSDAVAATLLFEQYCQRLVAPVLAALHPRPPQGPTREAAGDRDRVPDPRRAAVLVLIRDGALQQAAFRRTLAATDGASSAVDVMRQLVMDNLEPVAAAVHRHGFAVALAIAP
ncbi:MAG: hypothetical protein L0H64_04095, partial [Pseudonocardia sp.]|nr:hypothetical protein [Pseudonocardia sp.]